MNKIYKYLKPKSKEQEIAMNNAIFFGRVGSQMYGTNTPDSDDDFMGVFIEPLEYKLGRKHFDFVEINTNDSSSGKRNKAGDLDCKFYSLDKWLGLLQGNNPNQLEILFIDENNILFKNDLFEQVLASRSLFLSKKLKHSFSGYAYSQVKRNELKSGNQTGRVELIQQWGFDTKLASHALRLYSECLDLLVGGEIKFPLYNNNEILDIKRGLFSHEEFQKRCAVYEPLIEKAYIESKLPYSPDIEGIHKLQIDLYKQFYKNEFREFGEIDD